MKVSLNKLRYINEHQDMGINLVPDGVDALVAKIGAQLGGVDEVMPVGQKLEGIVIVRVVKCVKHPNADKLNVCLVDDGGVVPDVKRDEGGLVQVICGAPNARADILAAWVPPGVTVPVTYGSEEPLVIEVRDIRGQVSNGMLASFKELGIGDNHEGIVEVDREVAPGTSFNEAYRAEGEVILDIENKMFTHRPDCFGLMGIAREVAGIQKQAFKSPDWYVVQPDLPEPSSEDLPFKVDNQLPELAPRFSAIAIKGVEIRPSPVWLQIVLSELGVRPINNVVDLANFYMLETGQPLHTFDYDKVKAASKDGATIVVRHPKKGEKLELINGKTIEPRSEAIMIATDGRLIGVAGVMGGSETEVDDNTKNLIIEVANFDMYSIRRTSMEHGIFSDAVTRFTKGQSPLQTLAVLAKVTEALQEIAGGQVASKVIDDNHLDKAVVERGSLYPAVKVSSDFINQRLGLELSALDMKQLLENVEFKVDVDAEVLTVSAPFWRTDIEIREDVVEEVGRLYGYDHLPQALPKRDLSPAARDPLLSAKALIRARLARAGANEVLTYSFVHGDLIKKAGQDATQAFQLANALSPDLQYYRISLLPSLLDKVHPNLKAGYNQFVLFEIGKAHRLDNIKDELPGEHEMTSLVIASDDKLNKAGAPYFEARKYLVELAKGVELTFKPVDETIGSDNYARPYAPGRSAVVSLKETGEFLGILGEFKASVRRALKLPKYCAGFEIDTEVLGRALSAGQTYTPLPRFPKVVQDITLRVESSVSYEQLYDLLVEEVEQLKPANTWSECSPEAIYQKDDRQKNVTFRLTIASYERTLTDQEVNKLLDSVADRLKSKVGAERV